MHDRQGDTVKPIDGVRAGATAAGAASNFTAALSSAERAAYNARTPHRLAVKHVHPQRNPEAERGADTLRAIDFAFYGLNEQLAPVLPSGKQARLLRPETTIVVASSASNGAGVLARRASDRSCGTPYTASSRPLLDDFTFANLYQPCAALSAHAAGSLQPLPAAFVPLAQNRCATGGSSAPTRSPCGPTRRSTNGSPTVGRPRRFRWIVSHWRFATPPITAANVSPRTAAPAAGDRITFDGRTMRIPD